MKTGDVSHRIVCAQLLGALLLSVVCPRTSFADPGERAGLPINAVALVVGKHRGREVDRWAGALDWQGTVPIELICEKRGNKWQWKARARDELARRSMEP